MPPKTLEIEGKFQEILPPPIIFETARTQHRSLKPKQEAQTSTFCPNCGFSVKK